MNVELKYCSMWNYEPQAVSLTATLLTKFKQKIKDYKLIPEGGGCFEITVNGELIYSKLKTGKFPEEKWVVETVSRLAKKWAAGGRFHKPDFMLFFGKKKRLIDYASCAGWAGKLPPQGIAQVLRHLPTVTDPNLLVGAATHDDAGVYRLTDDIALVQTLDFFPPVVNDPFAYGQIAASNSLSDVYAMGGRPLTALNLIGYPDDKDPELVWLGDILKGGAERCQAAGCVIVGGHSVRDSEIKFGYAVTGLVHPKKIFTNANAKPGDVLVLTKQLGTGFATTAHRAGACTQELYDTAVAGMIQLNDIGRDAMIAADANAATDITGFGLAGHSYEMAQASGVSMVIQLSKLPLLPGAEAFARKPYLTRASATNAAYVAADLQKDGLLDPTRLEFFYDAQTSGGMLISVPAERGAQVVEFCKDKGVAAAIIGEVNERRDKALILRA